MCACSGVKWVWGIKTDGVVAYVWKRTGGRYHKFTPARISGGTHCDFLQVASHSISDMVIDLLKCEDGEEWA